jgi:hypothetical protein
MFMILFVVLAVAWILGWGAFHVAGALIHLLLIVALVSLIVHFVRGRALSVRAGVSATRLAVDERGDHRALA